MRIAYIGPAWGTSLQRAKALERLGHRILLIDPWSWLARPRLRARLHFRTGYAGVGPLIGRRILGDLRTVTPDLVWVNQGEFLGPGLVRAMGRLGVPLVNYANDNPFSSENRRRFRLYRSALPHYDLVVVVFASAVEAARRCGARRVVRKFLSADEVAHQPRSIPDDLRRRYGSEVAFVGTLLSEQRGSFMAELVRKRVPLAIWGDRWERARRWEVIRPCWRGPGVYDEDGYAAIIQCAKVCIGLVNKSSGNLHTGRSVQIPAIGSVLCAERTSEHLELYEEDKEAVFWEGAEECAEKCRMLLADEGRRCEIARRGHERAMRNNLFNEPVMASILDEATRVAGRP